MYVTDGRTRNLTVKTGLLTAHIMTLWAPAMIRLMGAVLPGCDDTKTRGSKTLREQLNTDVKG